MTGHENKPTSSAVHVTLGQPECALHVADSAPPMVGTLKPPEYAFAIRDTDGEWLVGVRPDGSIRYGDNYTPDAAAREFWDAMSLYMPARCTNCGHLAGGEA